MHSIASSPNMHIEIKQLICIVQKIIGNSCATCLWQKGEVGASTIGRSSFLSASLIHQTSHNKHAFKQSFKKLWHAWYATHFKAYDMHDVQLLGDTCII